MIKQRWDIFCKVVDNFGDIGVCWRLAKQLSHEHGLQICLWVDDLDSAKKIITSLNINLNQQVADEISVKKWHAEADFSQAADVVIETFACELPPAYLAAMPAKNSKWVNLEYLSAETWVDDFHAKPSPQANGLIRYFYFPGFTETTGGLLREKEPFLRHSDESRNPATLTALDSDFRRNDNRSLKISLFCYPNAPIVDLFDALQANNHAVAVHVPESSILPKITAYFGKNSVQVGDKLTQNNLSVEILPFLSQADYDALLRNCDLNFVRGEDSWIRAIWAGKPFIWQPYFQTENTHIKKLTAFIDLFYKSCEQKQMLWKAHEYWAAGLPWNDLVQGHASGYDAKTIWQNYFNTLQQIQTYTKTQSKLLAEQADLATKLVIFCNALNNA